MTRKRIVAGNWKMNLTYQEAIDLAKSVNELSTNAAAEIYIFPSALYLDACKRVATTIQLGAQNAYFKNAGAFTGEVSMTQLTSLGVNAVLIGHSERRELFHETDELLKEKLDAALQSGLVPFFCCGEPLEIRESGNYLTYVKAQFEASVFHLNEQQIQQVVFAYEPIWAIGTGKTATSEQAEEMHAAIRSWLSARYSEEIAASISILYGGSCNPSNAKSLFACPNVDGGLIGGAALKIEDFKQLVAKETWTI
jgi:triosephosphate isomerase